MCARCWRAAADAALPGAHRHRLPAAHGERGHGPAHPRPLHEPAAQRRLRLSIAVAITINRASTGRRRPVVSTGRRRRRNGAPGSPPAEDYELAAEGAGVCLCSLFFVITINLTITTTIIFRLYQYFATPRAWTPVPTRTASRRRRRRNYYQSII